MKDNMWEVVGEPLENGGILTHTPKNKEHSSTLGLPFILMLSEKIKFKS